MGSTDSTPARVGSRTLVSVPKLAGVTIAAGVMIAIGVAWPIAVLAGVGGYAIGFFVPSLDRPVGSTATTMDPFTVGDPWRRFVQGAQRSASRLRQTVDATPDGPLKDRMGTIAGRLDDGLAETWAIARRGDQIDRTIRDLEPTALRSKLATLEQRRDTAPSDDVDEAIESVEAQIAATERLNAESAKTADRLRLTQTRLDELVARAAEVGIGVSDTDVYAHDVDDLVIELESLRQALEETNRP